MYLIISILINILTQKTCKQITASSVDIYTVCLMYFKQIYFTFEVNNLVEVK